ncbi:uncharacterized protein LOC135480785 [Liolophura sinensis]|uniref:uncharacterized protein LOC135480785 n=1 Tax=Liolophura sinensis TaxID=3198878 RepID=UPI003158DCA3
MVKICLLFVVTSLLCRISMGQTTEIPTSTVISWIRKVGTTSIHESVVIDEKERTILMISSEAYKNNEDNSLALHDFQTGNVALRDLDANMCFVGKIEIPDFQAMKTMVEEREGKELQLPEVKQGHLTTKLLTSAELGPRLSAFCKGLPARWFDIDQKTETKTKRSLATYNVQCVVARLQLS